MLEEIHFSHRWTNNGLQKEYRKKAKKVDQEVLGLPVGEKGPVERRLEEFGGLMGLCFGAWGEASEGVHMGHHGRPADGQGEGGTVVKKSRGGDHPQERIYKDSLDTSSFPLLLHHQNNLYIEFSLNITFVHSISS